jgi:hypothetical protein
MGFYNDIVLPRLGVSFRLGSAEAIPLDAGDTVVTTWMCMAGAQARAASLGV